MSAKRKMNSSEVLEALRSKHAEDVFISECKSGKSWGGHLRLDAWTMKKSWASQCFTGYEIKVDRSDFLNDTKWPAYIPYCNQFYFVCPSGLIKPEEIGDGAGLMYVSENGNRVWRKKNAPRHEPDRAKLGQLFQYILMNRVKITSSTFGQGCQTDQQFWEQWLKEKQLNRDFGSHVGKAIGTTLRERINKVEGNQKDLENKIKSYAWLDEFLTSKGLSIRSSTWRMEQDIKKLIEIIPPSVLHSLEGVEIASKRCREALVKLLENENDVHVP